MDKLFICLANSSKKISENAKGATGRCVAGIEISKEKYDIDGSLVLIQECNQFGSRPKWIRPIDRNTETGAIPIANACTINVFDIILLHDVELSDTNGAHSENIFYRELKKVGTYPRNKISKLVDTLHKNFIFGNDKGYVDERLFTNFDHSLMLVHVSNIEFYYESRDDGKTKLRAKFQYGEKNIDYNFPVTDPKFCDKAYANKDNGLVGINKDKERYLVISLGMPYNSKHYKLIATVFDTEQ